jgi:hypothetical protein
MHDDDAIKLLVTAVKFSGDAEQYVVKFLARRLPSSGATIFINSFTMLGAVNVFDLRTELVLAALMERKAPRRGGELLVLNGAEMDGAGKAR